MDGHRPGGPVNGNGHRPAGAPRFRDDTTRYLCAAAHLDPGYADRAIREFLTEPTRPVPASPGLDTAAVLGEAVAARTRRKLRDLALILLMIEFVVVAPLGFSLGWLLLSLPFAVPGIGAGARKWAPKVMVWLVVGVIVAGALMFFFGRGLVAALIGDVTLSVPELRTPSLLVIAGVVLACAAMLTVLLMDRLVVWRHLRYRFWPDASAGAGPWTRDRPVFRFSATRQLTLLRRHTTPTAVARPGPAEGEPVPLTVYRGFVPFVGAGTPVDPWSIAVPLEELPDATPTAGLTTESLYAAIDHEMASLRATSTLAPGRRLGALGFGESVLVAAEDLIGHLSDPATEDFLKRPGVAPFSMIHPERARLIRAEPLEWARYYRCYQVETWDRDLVVTVYVHVAVGRGALYVEWTPCVLMPIRKEYRAIDQMPRSVVRPVGRAVLDLVALPASVPGRLVRLLSLLRPTPQDPGIISPDLYGCAHGLRELAADDDVRNYFQLVDVGRYLKMLESRLVLAVSRMMRAAGYSPASFDAQASSVVNNNIQIGGSVGGNVVAGTENKVGASAPWSK